MEKSELLFRLWPGFGAAADVLLEVREEEDGTRGDDSDVE